jgi:hypothetical protein
MSLGIICCRVLEREVRSLVSGIPEVSHLEVLEWGLHTRPELLLSTLISRIQVLQEQVQVIMLGYGRCLTLDRLPNDFKVPIIYPEGDDCIGVLLGQERYLEALQEEAGTWFLTPGWTELGMEFIFKELQVHRLAERNIEPLALAHRLLKDYTRSLFIDMNLGDRTQLLHKAREIAAEFRMRLEITEGSLERLQVALQRSLQALQSSRLTIAK